MIDVFKVADILVENVKAKYAEDIAIVVYYGSYAQGKAHSKSDLDFFFIPATEKGWGACVQFVLDGVGYDFWPIGWERAERIANFDEGIVSVVADSRVLYARSSEDLARFEALREKIAAMRKPENRQSMLHKASERFKEAYMYLYNLQVVARDNDLSAMRMEVYKLVTTVLHSLALLNQTYFKRGWGQNMEEVLALQLQPEGLGELLNMLTTEESAVKLLDGCSALVEKTRKLLIEEEKALATPQSFADAMPGFYEEAKGTLNKVVAACEREDYDTAFFAALAIQNEIAPILALTEDGVWHNGFYTLNEYRKAYDSYQMPDLARLLQTRNLDALKEKVCELDAKLVEALRKNSVSLKIFATLEEFASHVQRA